VGKRHALRTLALGITLTAAVATVQAQQQPAGSDADYIAKVKAAAPEAVVKDATILVMEKGGAMRTVQKGTNEFTCMTIGGDTPMCTDKVGMEWMHALMTHGAPPAKVGFMYMLAGDAGASNTDPFATGPKPDNHWVKTGPHVMILGAPEKAMEGYPRTADADPTKPYVMWAGTPYEHLMVPVH